MFEGRVEKVLDRVIDRLFASDLILTFAGALIVAVFGTFLTIYGLYQLSMLRHWYIALAIGPAILLLWWITREAYLRKGGERRIGIAYESHKVDAADWIKTQSLIRDLFRDSLPSDRVRICRVPYKFVSTDSRWSQSQKQYSFLAILRVVESAGDKPDDPSVFSAHLQTKFRDDLTNDFKAHVGAMMQMLFQEPARAPSALKRLELRAGTIFQTTTLFLAVHAFTNGRHNEASRLARHLDEQLKPRCRADHEPRYFVRWLDNYALMSFSAFTPRGAPVGDDLLTAKTMAKEAYERYNDQFPLVAMQYARTLFFAGNFDEALQVTRQAAKKSLPGLAVVTNTLNVAVLNLFASNWTAACQAFRDLFIHDDFKQIDYSRLIEFADVTSELGYPSAIFLQVLYRRIEKHNIEPVLQLKFDEWVSEDSSRDGLRLFMNNFAQFGLDRFRQKLPQVKLLPADYASFGKKKNKKKKPT